MPGSACPEKQRSVHLEESRNHGRNPRQLSLSKPLPGGLRILCWLPHRMGKTAGQRPFSVSARCLDWVMSSQPVDRLHPVLDFAHRLRERLDSVAQNTAVVDGARGAARGPDRPPPGKGTARGARAPTARRGRPLRCHHRHRRRHSRRLDRGRDPAGPPRRPLRPPPRRSTGPARRALRGDGRRQGQHRPGPAIVAALDRLPTTGEFAVSSEQRQAAETHLVAMAEHHDAEGVAHPRRPDLRGDRPRPRREVRRPSARSRRSPERCGVRR